jgi:hypothetical protein
VGRKTVVCDGFHPHPLHIGGFIPRFFWAILEFFANINAEAWDYLGFLIDEVEYVGHKPADTSTK